MLQENKAHPIFLKTNISYPLIRTRCSVSCNIRFEIHPFTLLTTRYNCIKVQVFSKDSSQKFFWSSSGVCEFTATIPKNTLNDSFQRCFEDHVKHQWSSFFEKILNGYKPLSIFTKKLHHRCWQVPQYALILWISSVLF